MKYIKLFMLMAAVTLLGACSSDDDSWNSAADVTVGMQSQNMTVSEGKGVFNVPIEVKGETDGNVFVTVEVKEVGENPAKEDVNYYVTDKTISISDGAGNVEIETVDDDDINDPRTFQVTIVDAKGAKISENASTTISLKDNDAEFYSKLQGKWKMTCKNARTGAEINWDVKITGASDESEADYNKKLYITGMGGAESEVWLSFNYDKETRQGTVAFDQLGTYMMFAANYGDPLGVCGVVPFNLLDGKLTDTPITGTWSADLKTVTFGEGTFVAYLVDYETGADKNAAWFKIKDIKLTR